MGDFAKVSDVAILQELRGGLIIFAEHTMAALNEAQGDVQGTLRWLRQEQLAYWRGELTKRQEAYTAAKQALQYKKAMEKNPLNAKYSYVDEKKALALAQKRLEEAQEKMTKVKRWIGVLEKEAFDYQGVVQGLMGHLEVGIPKACMQLDAMTAALEGYLAAAYSGAEAVEAAAKESVRRTMPPEDETLPTENPNREAGSVKETEGGHGRQ